MVKLRGVSLSIQLLGKYFIEKVFPEIYIGNTHREKRG